METQILAPTEEAVALAARILREGGLVGLPTETVYGLGANALDEAAVRAIFAAKGRPADNPLIVHVPTPQDAAPLCHISPAARALMERFCPGPLTLLMPKKPCVPDVVNAGLPSVAVRIPSHPVAQRVLRACGVPRGRAQRQHLRQAQPHHGPARLPRPQGQAAPHSGRGRVPGGAGEHRGGHDQRHPHGAPPRRNHAGDAA